MRWEKRWIKSYPIWVVQNKSVTAFQLVFSAFLYCHHFDCPILCAHFYLFHSHMCGAVNFRFCCHEIWILLFFFLCFVYRQIHFNFFFGMENLELLAFCFDLGKYVSIKRKRLTQIRMWFEHNKTFIVFVFYHFITKEENSNERLRTNFGTDSLSKRFFRALATFWNCIHIQKKV